MSTNYLNILNQVVRQPRHPATGETLLIVEIECDQTLPASTVAPTVVDFSRGGCKIRWNLPLKQHESVVIRLRDQSNGLCLEIPAEVRWARRVETEFEAGCQFLADLDYEHLGELFLAGFLSVEDAAT